MLVEPSEIPIRMELWSAYLDHGPAEPFSSVRPNTASSGPRIVSGIVLSHRYQPPKYASFFPEKLTNYKKKEKKKTLSSHHVTKGRKIFLDRDWILRPNFMEIHTALFVYSFRQTNRPTNTHNWKIHSKWSYKEAVFSFVLARNVADLLCPCCAGT